MRDRRRLIYLNGVDKPLLLIPVCNARPWDYWVKRDGKRRYVKLQPDGSFRERKPDWDRRDDT